MYLPKAQGGAWFACRSRILAGSAPHHASLLIELGVPLGRVRPPLGHFGSQRVREGQVSQGEVA